ncbi:rhodanese-like domain-containing protein 6 isoform X2 [Macadamia integrifolia]|uniref:rhodanese-like domain-containing protein 6 isoform X2 n=1 Tax=Macadamia integrifolia TaxID=60698 RepID=UPI001C4F21EC|nr:rhodanese-like domain-containing protein 6 isoform X2 [Macadamia integrifolia]
MPGARLGILLSFRNPVAQLRECVPVSERVRDMSQKEEEGVLLYYKFVSVPDTQELVSFYDLNCRSLGLLGRVRIASDGVNVTVGGKLSSLEKHIAVLKSNNLFEGTDFKLASCHCPSNEIIAEECGFTSLSIRVVKELVTFSSHPLLKSPHISNAGKHLSAVGFHSVLQSGVLENEDSTQNRKLILLDARNLYETRIGKFQTPNVQTLDPEIRQYSDLPAWIDNHSEQLQGNCVLMYCTGGIRCEMASSYIRSKGAGFEHVYQLFGGIQRYLEQFPDGGFFKGKNFVFDHRISVGTSARDIVGSCLLCGCAFDDYSSRSRCTYCRMLVLICDGCQVYDCTYFCYSDDIMGQGKDSALYVCELCQKHSKRRQMEDNGCPIESTPDDNSEVVGLESSTLSDCTTLLSKVPWKHDSRSSRRLRILCLHGFRQNASNFKGRTASFAKKLKNIAELVFVDAPHELPFIYQSRQAETCNSSPVQQSPPPGEKCKKRYAWLVAPEFIGSRGTDWEMASETFDPLQYQQQTGGFDISLAYLETVFSQKGPFDGILGFSQGAAMAAAVSAERGKMAGEIDFRFVILCSGFALNLSQVKPRSINFPSLHIFGNGKGKDRQIACHTSKELAGLFEEGCSVIIEHESGHIIPTQSPYIDQIEAFLQRFV